MDMQMRKRLTALKLDRNAVRITVIYLIIGWLWILFSDQIAAMISKNELTFETISLYKGWFYIFVTGLILYFLVRRSNSKLYKHQEKLQASEKNYRDIFENATIGIYRSTPDGRLLMVNPELASMFGYASPEEFLSSINDVANQIYRDPARRQDFLKKLNEQGFIKEFINQERRKDGSIIWTSTTARVVKDNAGNVLYYEGFDVNITERKGIEERIRKILDTAIDGFYLVEMDGRILEANDAYCSMIGYPREELLKMSIKDIEAVETEEVIKKRIQRIVETGSDHFETKHKRKDGKVIAVEASVNYLKDEQGKLFVFMRDITERKQMEGQLRASEEHFRSLYENSTVGIYRTTPDGQILLANPALIQMLGYPSFEELAQRNLENENDAGYQRTKFKTQIERDGEIRGLEASWRRRDGAAIFIRESAKAIRDSDGKVLYYEGTVEDITERKQAEDEVGQLSEFNHSLIQGMGEGIIVENKEGYITFANPAAAEMSGYLLDELIGKHWMELFPADQIAIVQEADQRRIAGKADRYEVKQLHKSGKLINVLVNGSPRYSNGIFAGTLAVLTNITERKQAEEALRQSENHFHSLFDNMLDGYAYCKMIYENDQPIDFIYLEVNDQFERLTSLKEVVGKKVSEAIPGIQKTNPELFEIYGKVALTGSSTKFETYVEELKIWFSISVYSVEKGYFVAVFDNITERKQAEAELQKAEEKYRTIFSESTEGIFQSTFEGKFLTANPALAHMLGYESPEELISGIQNLANQYYVNAHRREEFINLMQENGQVYEFEYEVRRKDGKTIWVSENARAVHNPIGAFLYYEGQIEDITTRKQAEEALLESEIRYRGIFDGAQDAIFLEGMNGDILDANQRACEIYGYSREEFLTKNVLDLVPSEKERIQLDENGIVGKGNGTVETINIRANGERFPVEISGRLWNIGDQRIFLVILRDITERKQAEESVRKANLYNRSLLEASLDPLVTIGPDGKIMDVNTSTENTTGLRRKELIGTDFSNYFTEPEKARSGYKEAFQKGAVRDYSLELKHRDGHVTPVSYNASVYYDAEGDLIGVFAAARDITERQQAEEALHMRLAELEIIYQSGLELSQILEPEQIAQKIIDQLEKQLDWHHSAIRLYDAESQTLKVIAFNVPGIGDEIEQMGVKEHFDSIVQKPGDGLTGWVAQHDQTLRIGDLKNDSRYLETFPGLNSGIYVPIKTESRVIGVISVENELLDAFNESDERLIRTLASQAAIAFENSRLQKETERQLHQLQALHSIDLAITNSLDLNIIIDVLINQAIQQLGLDAVAVFVLQSDINSLKYLSSKGFRAHLLESASQDLLLNESFAGRAIYGRRAVESPASQEPKDELKEIWMTEGFHTIYAIPLLTKGESKGVIEVFYRSENQRPTKIQKDFLETLASQAAIAIENIHLFEGLHRSNMELSIAYDATIEGWSRAMDLRDEETEGHTKRVVDMTLELAAGFGFSGDMLTQIRRGALLHDIGKLGVPDSILFKPGALTDEEWVVMKKHPTFAFEMLAPIQYLNRAMNIPYCHHEKWDGSGYPRGLSGEQIPLEARIFAAVDVWDALTSDRPYRKAWTKQKTIKYIQSLAGTHFDPAVVERFVELKTREIRQQK